MARFYLNLFNDVDTADEEGAEFADPPAAKKAAMRAARELMAAHVTAGRPIDLNHRIEIADEAGKVLAVMPFRELITVIDGRNAPS